MTNTPKPEALGSLVERLNGVFGLLTPGAIDRADLDGMAFTVTEAATTITTLAAERDALREIAEALDASWLEMFPDGPEADYGPVSLGDDHKALWIRFRATLERTAR